MTARKPLPATDRAALILQLVPYLIGKGEVSITEAADEFDVTPEQMRAMVGSEIARWRDVIQQVGIPLQG